MAGAPDWIQAIVSVLAVFAAAIAILIQSHELREQKNELAEQRKELALQREQLELQRQELARNVHVQERIAETAGDQHYLDLQLRLLSLTFERPELAAVFGIVESAEQRVQSMQRLYMTAWMRLLESGLALGQMAPETVEVELRESFFASQLGIDWWRSVEHAWRTDAELVPRRGTRVALVELIERICQDAEARQGSAPSGED